MAFIVALLILLQSPVTVTQKDFEKVISEYVASQLDGRNERYEIEFRNIPSAIDLQARRFSLEINPDRGTPLRGNISLPVDIIADGKTERRIVVSLRVRRFSYVFLSANTLPRHSYVTADDVGRLRVETTELPDDIVTDLDQFVDSRTNRRIQEGVILRKSMFERIPLIQSGSQVTVIVETGNVSISTTAIARDDGARGDIISIQRSGSNTRLRARVIDSSKVELVNDREAR